jgi:hypothetical protein
MGRQLLAGIVAGLALCAAAPTVVDAQVDRFRGTYVLDRAASDDVNAAIDQAVRGMNFVTRPVARGRLRKTNDAYPWIRVATDGNVTIEFASRNPTVSRPDGTAVRWRRDDGEEFDVSTRVVEGRLVQRFVAEDGRRTNTYVLSNDGRTLTMNVLIESPRLSDPLTYRLVYTRN